MDRRTFLKGAAALTALASPCARSEAKGVGRPNILIVLADDMGFSDAGCYGGEVETPHLDALAGDGLRYSQCYSTARCWPSRTCILTGYYAQQVRMDPPKGRLPEWARVLPHYFKPAGYRCYHSGKWHLRAAPKAVADGGFDHAYVLHDHDRFFSPKRHEEDDAPLPPIEPGTDHYVTTAIADHSIRCLKEHAEAHAGKPFLQYLAFNAPHFPLHALQDDIALYKARYRQGWDAVRRARHARQRAMGLLDCGLSEPHADIVPNWNLSPEELRARIGAGEAAYAVPWDTLTEEQRDFQATKMAIHAAMIHRMDREIGRVLDQLKAMGAYDNTLICFMSDNGASAEQIIRGDGHDPEAPPGSAESYLCLGPGWSTAANAPFRLHKHWVHEGGISSPFIVHWPAGGLPKGALRNTPCHFIDLLPTFLDLADITPAATWNAEAPPELPGRSLVPTFSRDTSLAREYLYWHHSGNRALRVDDWKIAAAGPGTPWELHDLSQDRSEMHNLADKEPARVEKMARLWQRCEDSFRKQAGSPK